MEIDAAVHTYEYVSACVTHLPIPLTILKPQNPSNDKFDVLRKRGATDFEALKK